MIIRCQRRCFHMAILLFASVALSACECWKETPVDGSTDASADASIFVDGSIKPGEDVSAPDLVDDASGDAPSDLAAGDTWSCPAATACTLYSRDNGNCVPIHKAQGTTCDDSLACTKGDVCDGKGKCKGAAYTCTPGLCQTSSTCDGKGACLVINATMTTVCDDGQACTKGDVCDGKGACKGAAYTCTPGLCEASSTCDGKGGCAPTYSAKATACDDGNKCTKGDVCDGKGACAGAAYTCKPGLCQASSSCDGKGGCAVTNSATLTTCDDKVACTKGDVCDGKGACKGTAYTCKPGLCQASSTCNGKGCTVVNSATLTACDDKVACTKGDVCDGKGKCLGAAYICKPTQCQASSTCDGTGCTVKNKPVGTKCDDGLSSTIKDVCDGKGGCAGVNCKAACYALCPGDCNDWPDHGSTGACKKTCDNLCANKGCGSCGSVYSCSCTICNKFTP